MAAEDRVLTTDGWRLAVTVDEPEGAVVGTVILAHAMMCAGRTFSRGFSRALTDGGFRTVRFDFRGHGDSGPGAHAGGDWSYDDLVRFDVPAIVAHARATYGGPLALVGHSLGAHVTAAALGLGLTQLDGLVLVAGNVWLPRLDLDRARRWKKRATLATVLTIARAAGRFPARALRAGSDDEPLRYWLAFERWWRDDAWTSDDGRDDYLAALARVETPALAIASDGDRLNCVPACALRFAASIAGCERHVIGGDGAPDHMGLVTRRDAPAAKPALAWLSSTVARQG